VSDTLTKKEEARQRLLAVLPVLLEAVGVAREDFPEGEVCLAVIGKNKDGSGRLTATLPDTEALFADLALVIGYDKPPPTKEEIAAARIIGQLRS
jgi:hypothetical protein